MKPVASAGPGPAVSLGQVIGRLPRRWPIATVSVLAVTFVPKVLQFPVPAVRLALWRDPAARFRPRVAPPAGWRHRG
jgi:hypothetical protein